MRSAISPRLATRIFLNMGALFAYSMTNNGCPYWRASGFSPRMRVIVPDLSASISLRIFMASMMQMVSPSLTWLPTSTKGLAPGLDDRENVPTMGGLTIWPAGAAGAGGGGGGAGGVGEGAGGRGSRWRRGRFRRRGRSGGGRRGRHGGRRMLREHGGAALDDADLAFGLGDFEFRDIGLGHQVDQGFEFSQIHGRSDGG